MIYVAIYSFPVLKPPRKAVPKLREMTKEMRPIIPDHVFMIFVLLFSPHIDRIGAHIGTHPPALAVFLDDWYDAKYSGTDDRLCAKRPISAHFCGPLCLE